jgi:hypothetical protein
MLRFPKRRAPGLTARYLFFNTLFKQLEAGSSKLEDDGSKGDRDGVNAIPCKINL